MMEDRWRPVDEIAACLGIKRDTVFKWTAGKQVQAHRMDLFRKFRKEEVDDQVRSDGTDETTDSNSK